jgi:hypothetical protein
MKNIFTYIFVLITSLSFAQISSIQVIRNANNFLNAQWTVSANNITTGAYTSQYSCSDATNKYVRTPDWVNDLNDTHKTSIPYKWGGFSSLSGFTDGIANGKYAGDIQTRHPDNTSQHYYCGTSAAVGLDCSGFTSRCFELSSHISTYGMAHNSNMFGFYNSYNDAQPGDIANKSASHVRLIVHINANGTLNTIEEGSGGGLWCVFPATYSASALSTAHYQPQYYNNMTHDGETVSENDDCIDAISLLSHSDCQQTAGSLMGATADAQGLGSCDTYTGTDSGKGVFYSFLATETTHTITVTPTTTDTDPVIVVYSGNDCNSLTEMTCMNATGINVQEQIIYSNFTVGQRYFVRVYHQGNSQITDGHFNICITHTPTQPAYIQYTNKIASDGILGGTGNRDGKLNSGETISLGFQLYNSGSGTAHNVSVDIICSDTDITITQSHLAFPDIDANTIVTGTGLLFEINRLAVAKDFDISLTINADEGTWTQTVPLHITTSETALMRFAYSGIHDGAGGGVGNFNQIIEPGESIDLDVYLKNIGKETAHNVVAILTTSDADINITDNQLNLGDINIGQTKLGSDFDFDVTSTCADKDVTFNLLISATEGNWDEEFVLHIQNTNRIKNDLLKSISVYPNPTKNLINIQNNSNLTIKEISIFSIAGKQLLQYNCSFNQIDLGNLTSGIYILQIQTESNQTINYKVIKE